MMLHKKGLVFQALLSAKTDKIKMFVKKVWLGTQHAETGMYMQYMRISSTAQHR